MSKWILGWRLAVLAAFSTMPLAPAQAADDYPTTVVADYVLGCMRANGQTRTNLERCSCSFDVVASIIPYDHYVTAETYKQMSLTSGEKSALFRESAGAKAASSELRRAQAEADIRCF